MYISDFFDFRKVIAQGIFDCAITGPHGIKDQSDHDMLVGGGVVAEKEYQALAGTFHDGILDKVEFEYASSAPHLKFVADQLKELAGSDGANALRARVKWLKENCEPQLFGGYGEEDRNAMSQELSYLEYKLAGLNFMNPWAEVILAKSHLSTKDAIPTLLGYLKDIDPNMRLGAAYLIGEVLPKETDAVIPALQNLYKDENPNVRSEAAVAMLKIEVAKLK